MLFPICVHMYRVCVWCPKGQKRASGSLTLELWWLEPPCGCWVSFRSNKCSLSLWSIPLSFVCGVF